MYEPIKKSRQKPRQIQIQLPLTLQPAQKLQQQQSQNIARKDYRNGTYIGNIINNTRNGFGLLAIDTGELLFGNWQKGHVCGESLYLSNDMRIFGKIGINGALQGFHVCKMISSVAGVDSGSDSNRGGISMGLYGNFKDSKLFGRFVAVIRQNIYLCNARNSQQLQIINRIKNNKKQSLRDMLTSTFPYIQTFQLHSYLQSLIKKYSNTALSKYYPTIQTQPPTKSSITDDSQGSRIFYGYSTHRVYNRDKCRQFGFILSSEELLSIGEHRNGLPHGLARVFEYQGSIHDGIFSNGKPNGIGVRYHTQSKKYTYGQFRHDTSNIRKYNTRKPDSNEIEETGTNWPDKIIKQYRKNSHLKSIYFDSEFGQISINIPHEQFRKIYKQLMAQQTLIDITEPVSTVPLNNYFTTSPYQNQGKRRYTESSPNQRVWNKKPNHSPNTFDRFKQKSFTKQTHQPIFGKISTSKDEDQNLRYRTSNNYSLADQKNVSPFIFEQSTDYKSVKQAQGKKGGKQEAKQQKNRHKRANTVYNMIGQFKK